MSFIYLETDRFVIRRWEPDDAGALHAVMSDERVHAFTGDKPWTMERTKAYIQLIIDKDFKSLEVFHGACVLKDGGAIIGLTGLNPYEPKRPELEWQFGVPYWGKGYATEIGIAVVREAFKTTDIEMIYGMVNPQNKASMRVMEKIGMTCLGLNEFRGEQDMFFRMQRTDLHMNGGIGNEKNHP